MSGPVDEHPVAVRLRLAADRAAGPRVLIDVQDLLRVLNAPRAAEAVDLDGLSGCDIPGNIIPPPTTPNTVDGLGAAVRAVQPPEGRGRRHVVLASTNFDATRLARAAHDTHFPWIADHGPFDTMEPGPQWDLVKAARAAIDFLADE